MLGCLPVNYITLFDSSMKDLKAFKSVRLLRLFKLLRLARIKRIIQRHGDGSLQAYVGLGMTLFGILFAAHMLTPGGEKERGWGDLGGSPEPPETLPGRLIEARIEYSECLPTLLSPPG
jgi:hypothetical protein